MPGEETLENSREEGSSGDNLGDEEKPTSRGDKDAFKSLHPDQPYMEEKQPEAHSPRLFKVHTAHLEKLQNTMPLPMRELMEEECLQILTEALNTYESRLGKDHLLTKDVERRISELKKSQHSRLHRMSQ